MKTDLKSVLMRARGTLVQDMAGLCSLVVMLLVGLHLPSLI
ncbi:hypothetical protein R5H32_05330 [Defluviimonas sp. D31]|uniref:Uncharacterized protein n=2 Tax=Albidovulum TaxID=205889 RepID=A0ABT3IY71_9RHOB|nr:MULTISPECIES: hypothetical protein [Defluviimonas]MCU9846566.1 hypothetical protein [Defluviimonas sp. WL0024]MCW3780145.1 hypothetical protein [Defluviimonas salinarum]MDW4548771.1 hypothetical protein [Defluviimonas sp. D31]